MINNLKEIRMDRHMERNEFAEFLNVKIKTYYHWETGISRPNLEQAIRVSKKLNMNIIDIWDIEEEE